MFYVLSLSRKKERKKERKKKKKKKKKKTKKKKKNKKKKKKKTLKLPTDQLDKIVSFNESTHSRLIDACAQP